MAGRSEPMALIRLKRGTRSEIETAASADGLVAGEPYLVTDEERLAIATATDMFKVAGKPVDYITSFGMPAAEVEGDLAPIANPAVATHTTFDAVTFVPIEAGDLFLAVSMEYLFSAGQQVVDYLWRCVTPGTNVQYRKLGPGDIVGVSLESTQRINPDGITDFGLAGAAISFERVPDDTATTLELPIGSLIVNSQIQVLFEIVSIRSTYVLGVLQPQINSLATEVASRLRWMDEWDAGTEYKPNDLIIFDGYAYISLTTHTNQDPLTTLGEHWYAFSVTGEDGETGPMGGETSVWTLVAPGTGDPSTGRLRMNSSPGTTTQLRIHETDADGNNTYSWMSSLGPGSVINIYDYTDPTVWARFLVVSNSLGNGSGSSYNLITVSAVGTAGTLPVADLVYLTVSRAGPAGDTGSRGGETLFWSFSTTTSAGASTGTIRRNNSTPASVTKLYVSLTDYDGNSASSWLATVPIGASISLYDSGNPWNTWAKYVVTATAGFGAYREFTVTYGGHAGTFTNGMLLDFTVSRPGPVVPIAVPSGLSATGTPSSTTFLDGAGAWRVPQIADVEGLGSEFINIGQSLWNLESLVNSSIDVLPKGGVAASAGTAQVTSNSTTYVDVISVTWTAVAGRKYKITLSGHYVSSVAGDITRIALTTSANGLTLVKDYVNYSVSSATAFEFTALVDSSSSGSLTYKMRVSRAGGTGTVRVFADATRPSYMIVEDIGLA